MHRCLLNVDVEALYQGGRYAENGYLDIEIIYYIALLDDIDDSLEHGLTTGYRPLGHRCQCEVNVTSSSH